MRRGWLCRVAGASWLATGLSLTGYCPGAQAQFAPPGTKPPTLEACPSSKTTPLVLPHVKEAIAANHEVTIVALGSSSTQGWHATDIAHSYPAILQQDLNTALPTAHVAIINRGVGGEDVAEMLPRLDRDVLAVHPTMVIWQVGANGAMKHMPPELFKRLLTTGVRRLQDAHLDVVLMDNQRSPNVLSAPEHLPIEQAMADVAVATGVGLFDRGALMDEWRQEGFPYERFVSDDGIHHNDYGYRCMANALASAVEEGLGLSIDRRTAAAKRSP